MKKKSLWYIRYVMNYIGKGSLSEIVSLAKWKLLDKPNQGNTSVESQSSEKTALFSNVILREESRNCCIQS